jgi:hypothetical protein
MATVKSPMDEWKHIPWKQLERSVFKLQKRIYQASQQKKIGLAIGWRSITCAPRTKAEPTHVAIDSSCIATATTARRRVTTRYA